MSTAAQYRADAVESLGHSLRVTCADPGTGYAMQAATSALLAIEARLGELVDAQRAATELARSAYGMTDAGGVQQLVNSIGDAMYRATTGGEG